MYEGEDSRDWSKENLFSYSDTKFNSQSRLEISVHTSTTDYKKFSKLKTIISIVQPDGYRKNISLTYPELYELISSLKEATTNDKLYDAYERGNFFSVDRPFSENNLKITFKASRTGEWCVLVWIISSNTDYGLVIFPVKLFYGLFEKLKFITDYEFQIQDKLANRLVNSKNLEYSNLIVQQLKKLPVQISELLPEENKQVDNQENNLDDHSDIDQEVGTDQNDIMSSLNDFMENNLDNIEPEALKQFEEKENQSEDKPVVETSSKLFDNVLGKDISNLEHMMNRILPSNSKIESFSNTIKEETGIDLISLFNNDDIKSTIYITEVDIQSANKRYLINGDHFPETCTMIKTEPSDNSQEVIDLAYDLLICQAYIKSFRNYAESRTPNPEENKSKLHVNLRYTTDLFIYSFISTSNKSVIRNSIISRFRYFDQQGYFEPLNKELEDLGFNRIPEKDILNYISKALELSENGLYVKNLHSQLYNDGTLRIPPENNFTKEQISREVVKLEVIRLMNYDFSEESLKKFGIEKDEISNEVFRVFSENKNPSGRKKNKTNIVKYVSYFKDNLSEDLMNNLIEYLESIGTSDFDFNNSPFLIEDLPESIAVGLYIWNRSNKNEKFSEFYTRCEESVMSKEDIKNKIYSDNSEVGEELDEETSSLWDDIAM